MFNSIRSYKAYENTTISLIDRIKKLEFELYKISKSQILKEKIHYFLHHLLTINSSEVLIDITFNEKEPQESIILFSEDRPRVKDSDKTENQMRHVTPYSFIQHLIRSNVYLADSLKTLSSRLQEDLEKFLLFEEGLCLPDDLYVKVISKTSTEHRIKVQTKNNTYYLIGPKEIKPSWQKKLKLNDEQYQAAKNLYQKRKKQIWEEGIKYLHSNIQDENTYNIVCEILSRFILTLFNQKSSVAFPEECNTQIQEIRSYDKLDDAEEGNKKYQIVTARDILTKFQVGEDLNRKIRIVKIEGNLIRFVPPKLKAINKILTLLQNSDIIHDSLDTLNTLLTNYNSLPHTPIYFANFLCPEEIEINCNKLPIGENLVDKTTIDDWSIVDDLKSLLINHIAKNLYLVFDFKALEKTIFVPSKLTEVIASIEVFNSAEGKKRTDFHLQDGLQYRKKEKEVINKINSNPRKRNKITVRPEEEFNLLTKKAMEHLEISLKAFFSTIPTDQQLAVVKSFINLVLLDYGITQEDLETSLQNSRYYKELIDEASSETLTTVSSLADMSSFFEDNL